MLSELGAPRGAAACLYARHYGMSRRVRSARIARASLNVGLRLRGHAELGSSSAISESSLEKNDGFGEFFGSKTSWLPS